jgi:hypothetical protein
VRDDPEFVAQVRVQRVVRGQLHRHLLRQFAAQAALLVDVGELLEFGLRHLLQLAPLLGGIGGLGIGLRADRDVFACGHRQGACDQGGDAGGEDGLRRGRGGGHADQQRTGRDQPIVGAQHRRAQPADVFAAVPLVVRPGQASWHR